MRFADGQVLMEASNETDLPQKSKTMKSLQWKVDQNVWQGGGILSMAIDGQRVQ